LSTNVICSVIRSAWIEESGRLLVRLEAREPDAVPRFLGRREPAVGGFRRRLEDPVQDRRVVLDRGDVPERGGEVDVDRFVPVERGW